MGARAASSTAPRPIASILVTGNAAFSPASHHWGDTVLALNPDGSGNANGDPLDTYTPANFAQLNSLDLDLGSTAPAILPVTDTRKVQNLAVQGGKDQMLRLLNLDNLSGHGGPGSPAVKSARRSRSPRRVRC